MYAHRNEDLPRELARAFDDAADNLRIAVRTYILDNQRSQYRTVAVQLRILLLDENSARSFVGKGSKSKSKSLLELVYGNQDKILMQSLLPKERLDPKDGWRDVGPPLYGDPRALLAEARNNDRLVSLRKWLSECPVYDDRGGVRQTQTVLQDIADKEGAHSIKAWGGKDWRNKAGIALTSRNPQAMTLDEVAALEYGLNWEQFVIGAAARLLYACRREEGALRKLFDTKSLDLLIRDQQDVRAITLQNRT